MGLFSFIGDGISDVMGGVTFIVTKPLGVITNTVAGGVTKVMKPVTDLAGSALTDATGLVDGGQKMLGGVAKDVTDVFQPIGQGLGNSFSGLGNGISGLGNGLGGGAQAIGQGVGGGANSFGQGMGEGAEWLPIVAVAGGIGILMMELDSNKRGGSFIGNAAKKMRLS